MTLWLAAAPLVLASQSRTRRDLLEGAGIPVETRPADIDERAVEARAGLAAPGDVAQHLAQAKAAAVAASLPDRLVLGADQTLSLDGRRFSKPKDQAAARSQLAALRGRTHELHSALALLRGSEILYRHVAVARLTMRAFSDDFLEGYLEAAGPMVYQSVGGYQLERIGVQLFEAVAGEHTTILGLPLIPLLTHLRAAGHLRS
jgi:septum formation protein